MPAVKAFGQHHGLVPGRNHFKSGAYLHNWLITNHQLEFFYFFWISINHQLELVPMYINRNL